VGQQVLLDDGGDAQGLDLAASGARHVYAIGTGGCRTAGRNRERHGDRRVAGRNGSSAATTASSSATAATTKASRAAATTAATGSEADDAGEEEHAEQVSPGTASGGQGEKQDAGQSRASTGEEEVEAVRPVQDWRWRMR